MKILNLEQGSPEWIKARSCMVTGTKLDDVMGSSLARVQLISELIAEEATEQTKSFKVTSEMERGTLEEPFAVKAFETKTGKKIDKSVGFCISDEFPWFGFSPDGFILDLVKNKYTEGIEIKNPDTKTAMFYRLTNMVGMRELGLGTFSKTTDGFTPSSKNPFLGIPADYKWQVVAGFLVNQDLEKMSFLVYDARILDDNQKLYVVEVFRNNELLQEAMAEARTALIKFRSDWLKWRDIILPSNF